MKLPRSIRWRLQLWYGLILVVVLAGFGFTAYQLEWGRQMRRVDDGLQRRFDMLAGAFHGPPFRHEHGGPMFDHQMPPDQLPHDARPPGDLRPPQNFTLPPPIGALFGTNDANGFYFRITAITNGGEKEIARSENFPGSELSLAGAASNPGFGAVNHDESPIRPSGPPRPVNFEDNRVIAMSLPSREMIEVGCSIKPELRELHRTMLNLTTVGGLILLIGLAGGWWISSRVIRPIADISATAVKISAGDLSQRIDVSETESELGRLAAVLNSTFARLETAFAQQKQFAADAAHELRTPISVLLTQTQTALSRERGAGDYRETLEACQRSAQRMRRLITSLLELARFDAGQEVLRRDRFDISRVAAEGMQWVKPLADEHGIKIVADLPPLEITGDMVRMGQVVANLLTNAVQYNRPGGEVRLSVKNEKGLAVLTVADTGSGISAGELPRVFERFYRADQSRAGGGAGLGLSICKAIVEAHGGTIEASSRPKEGSTFTVRLPA